MNFLSFFIDSILIIFMGGLLYGIYSSLAILKQWGRNRQGWIRDYIIEFLLVGFMSIVFVGFGYVIINLDSIIRSISNP